MAKLTQFLTPKGTAMYPHVRKPEFYQGKEVGYTIQLQLSKSDSEKLLAKLEEELAVAKKSSEFSGKRWSKEPNMGVRYDKNEDMVFKFKTHTTIKTKTGEIIERSIPIFDAKGNPFKGDFGHGSTVKVAFSIAPYHMSATNNGLSLYLNAIQLINLVEPNSGGNASSFGFEQEDGFDVKDSDALEENPFDGDAPQSEEEF